MYGSVQCDWDLVGYFVERSLKVPASHGSFVNQVFDLRRRGYSHVGRPKFFDLVPQFSSFMASEDSDRLFALYSLCKEEASLEPDYESDLAEVVLDIVWLVKGDWRCLSLVASLVGLSHQRSQQEALRRLAKCSSLHQDPASPLLICVECDQCLTDVPLTDLAFQGCLTLRIDRDNEYSMRSADKHFRVSSQEDICPIKGGGVGTDINAQQCPNHVYKGKDQMLDSSDCHVASGLRLLGMCTMIQIVNHVNGVHLGRKEHFVGSFRWHHRRGVPRPKDCKSAKLYLQSYNLRYEDPDCYDKRPENETQHVEQGKIEGHGDDVESIDPKWKWHGELRLYDEQAFMTASGERAG